jgi:4-amino-4-deoxy-L-arabinose transferase-like glycosyltransferase
MMLALAMVLPGLASVPVIDRDEARFAQASAQMAETNEFLHIKFQDEARNKKPAAAYWAQTAAIKIFNKDAEKRLWVQRLPSVLAALLTIFALYWGGQKMVGRAAAFIACALLATSLIFVFEGHIAKTDALLCASTTLMFASLGRLRAARGRREVWVFWAALGASIMIKGPIGPVLAILTFAALWKFDESLAWAKPLLHIGAIGLFLLLWVPWAVAIFVATDGAFFIESLGKDFGGKVVSGQENHGAPPGTHSLAIWLTLWPASLFLPLALAFAMQTCRAKSDERVARAMRLALCWAVPFWILIELMPTKLPHYGLPIFPALCLIMGAAIDSIGKVTREETSENFKITRRLGGGLFIFSSLLLVSVLVGAQSLYGEDNAAIVIYIICGLAGLLAIFAGVALWKHRISQALGAALLSAIILTLGVYSALLPNMPAFNTSERLAAELSRFAPGTESHAIHSPHFTEPSLVYHVGDSIDVKAGEVNLSNGRLAILDTQRDETAALLQRLTLSAQRRGLCLADSKPIAGLNYSKGSRPVELVILKEVPCAEPSGKRPT